MCNTPIYNIVQNSLLLLFKIIIEVRNYANNSSLSNQCQMSIKITNFGFLIKQIISNPSNIMLGL